MWRSFIMLAKTGNNSNTDANKTTKNKQIRQQQRAEEDAKRIVSFAAESSIRSSVKHKKGSISTEQLQSLINREECRKSSLTKNDRAELRRSMQVVEALRHIPGLEIHNNNDNKKEEHVSFDDDDDDDDDDDGTNKAIPNRDGGTTAGSTITPAAAAAANSNDNENNKKLYKSSFKQSMDFLNSICAEIVEEEESDGSFYKQYSVSDNDEDDSGYFFPIDAESERFVPLNDDFNDQQQDLVPLNDDVDDKNDNKHDDNDQQEYPVLLDDVDNNNNNKHNDNDQQEYLVPLDDANNNNNNNNDNNNNNNNKNNNNISDSSSSNSEKNVHDQNASTPLTPTTTASNNALLPSSRGGSRGSLKSLLLPPSIGSRGSLTSLLMSPSNEKIKQRLKHLDPRKSMDKAHGTLNLNQSILRRDSVFNIVMQGSSMDIKDMSYVRKPKLAKLAQIAMTKKFHRYKNRYLNAQMNRTLCYPTLKQPKEDKNGVDNDTNETYNKGTEMVQTRDRHRFIITADTQFGILMDGFAMDDPSWRQEVEMSRECVKAINAMRGIERPLFVCVCGDLVDTEASFSTAMASWKKVFNDWERQLVFEQQCKDWKDVWSRLDDDIAMVCLCGNHDVGNRPTRASIESWTSIFGDDYLAFWVNGTYNIGLNNCLFSNPTGAPEMFDEQLEWLGGRLRYARERSAKQIFVYSHFPWFIVHEDEQDEDMDSVSFSPEGWGPSGTKFSDFYFNVPIETRKMALSLFREYNVTACFSGHFHQNVVTQTSWGMPMIITGPLSMTFKSTIQNKFGRDKQCNGLRTVDCFPSEGAFRHTFVPLVGERYDAEEGEELPSYYYCQKIQNNNNNNNNNNGSNNTNSNETTTTTTTINTASSSSSSSSSAAADSAIDTTTTTDNTTTAITTPTASAATTPNNSNTSTNSSSRAKKKSAKELAMRTEATKIDDNHLQTLMQEFSSPKTSSSGSNDKPLDPPVAC